MNFTARTAPARHDRGSAAAVLLLAAASTIGFDRFAFPDTFVRYATAVPNAPSPSWWDESECQGDPGCGNCPCDATSIPLSYNDDPPDSSFLEAVNFEQFVLPPGQTITSVRVDVMGRFNSGTTGKFRVRVDVPALGLDLGPFESNAFTSGENCTYRLLGNGDITNAIGQPWTQQLVNNLEVRVRRLNNDTRMRVKAFKIEIVTAPIQVCPATGSCCEPHGTPGCSDAACCNAVCAGDPFCCESEWDAFCVDGAVDLCGGLCAPPVVCPGPGSCCEPHGTPGCSDAACCNTVCASDPFCCDSEWDELCVAAAVEGCGFLCGNADLNGDGRVDPVDLSILLGQWGSAGSADFNGDGQVGPPDLAFLLSSWS